MGTAGRPLRGHDDLHMDGVSEVWIAVPPDVAYAAVSDLTRMGAWSPENRGGEWLDGAAPVAGAVFHGVNEDANGPWDTICSVTEAVAGAAFAWRVADPGEVNGTDWRFAFRPERGGTVVTETFTWRWTPVPDEGFRGRVGRMPLEVASVVVAARERDLRAAIALTLANLRDALESV